MALLISEAMLAGDLAGSEAADESASSRASSLEAGDGDNKENVPRFQSSLASIHLRSNTGPIVCVYDATDETTRSATARTSTVHAPQQPGAPFTVHVDKPKRSGKPKARAAAKELPRHADKENIDANVAEPPPLAVLQKPGHAALQLGRARHAVA